MSRDYAWSPHCSLAVDFRATLNKPSIPAARADGYHCIGFKVLPLTLSRRVDVVGR
jgi:hypothetical protein